MSHGQEHEGTVEDSPPSDPNGSDARKRAKVDSSMLAPAGVSSPSSISEPPSDEETQMPSVEDDKPSGADPGPLSSPKIDGAQADELAGADEVEGDDAVPIEGSMDRSDTEVSVNALSMSVGSNDVRGEADKDNSVTADTSPGTFVGTVSELNGHGTQEVQDEPPVRSSTQIIRLDEHGHPIQDLPPSALSRAQAKFDETPEELPLLPPTQNPHAEGAFVALSESEAERWTMAIDSYEREALALGEVKRASPIYLEIGRIYEEKLGRRRKAASAYQKAFDLDSSDIRVLHASRRLFSEIGNWNMVVQILDYEIERSSSLEEKATLLSQKGAIFEHQLNNLESAQSAYEEALDIWSAEPLAISALEQIHLYNKQHEALFGVYERALEVESESDRRLHLYLAAAHLAEDRLNDVSRAINLHEKALVLEPQNRSALMALRRLYQQSGNDEALVTSLERSADATGDIESASVHLLAAARVLSVRLKRPEDSISMLVRGLQRTPNDRSLLRELELLYRSANQDDELVEVLNREASTVANTSDRAAILHRLGRAWERVGQLEKAVESLQTALDVEAGYKPAAQALGRILQALKRHEELAELYVRELKLETDSHERVIYLFKLAELRTRTLDDDAGAIEALTELLTLQKEYPPARKLLEQLLIKGESYQALVELYEEEVELTADNDLKIFLLGRIGALAEDKLEDYERAQKSIERQLELSPKNLFAIRSLARLAERQNDDAALLRLLELETEATEDQAEVLDLMHRRAWLLSERLEQREESEKVLNEILSINPTYLPALKSLGRLYALNEKWQELVEMHNRELEVSKNPQRRADLLFRVAQVREERLNDLAGAVSAYELLIELDTHDVATIRALADLYARQGQTEKLADLLQREAEGIKESTEQAEVLMQVAELYEERLDRGDVAAELYQRVLKLGGFVDACTQALVRIYSREGMWNALASALRLAAERASDPKIKAAVLIRLAHVHRENLKNQDVSAELLEQALTLTPDDRNVLELLERVSVARRDWPRALQVGELLAELEVDPKSYAARQIGLATMAQSQLEPPQSGAEYYRKALQAHPGHPLALRALEVAYRAARDWKGLAYINIHEASTSSTDPSHKATLLVRAAELHEERLNELESAAELYDQALEASPRHLPALKGRRRLAEQLSDIERALTLLDTERRITVDEALCSVLTLEEGRLLQDRLKDIPRAIKSYQAVLDVEPENLAAFNRLEAIFLSQEDFPEVEALLKARAKSVSAPDEQARLLVSAGRVAEERIKNRANAIDAYHGALEREPENAAALVRLGPLLFAEKLWAEAVDIFHRTLLVTEENEVLRDAYKALGIIYQEHQRDLVKSVQSFQQALQVDSQDTESLHRLANLYRGARDWGSAVNVMLRLAEIEPEVDGKTSALLQLAELYLDGLKDAPHAINALRKAVELDPSCRPALIKLTELHDSREEWNDLVEVAGIYVSLLAPEEKSEATPLHLRMADVFERRLGDDNRAINALRYVLEDEPRHEQALSKLATLYGKKVETYPQAVEIHRRILADHPFAMNSYHELHRIFERLGQHDRAFVAAEVLVFLQAHTPEEYVYFQENKIFVPQMAEAQLSPQQHSAWVVHPLEKGVLREAFELLAPELGRAYPGQLQRHDLRRENRLGPRTAMPVRAIADELSGMFQVPSFEMWLGRPDDVDVHAENERPPVLVVGGRFAKRLPPKNQRFLLGRALEGIKGGHLIFEAASDRELEALVWSAVKLGQPNQRVPLDPEILDSAQRHLVRHISTRTRRVLEDMMRQLSVHQVNLSKHREGARYTANRAGLIASNDIETAIRAIARGHPNLKAVFSSAEEAVSVLSQIPEVCDLLPYAMSEEYFEARTHLGFSIQDS